MQNNSNAGDDKLIQAVQQIYSRHNRPEDSAPEKFDGVKTASEAMHKLKDMDRNGKLYLEDKNGNGTIEIPEIFVRAADGRYRAVPELKQPASADNRSMIEKAYDNVMQRNRAVDARFDK